ncbi:MAG TPA: sigma-54 dependent transcriptional regulator [Candidatus Polarisedimenticolaceae bacterium]|nr:sigma-54 dependent transcriptional regulator [Candidatus Polarisedimenticolaceae bacterium]
MSLAPEHSPGPPTASNTAPHPWRVLAAACRELACGGSIEAVLQRALEASGAERAYLLLSTTRVEALTSNRADGDERMSRAIARRALTEGGGFTALDAEHGSVRGLRLRWSCSARLPAPSEQRVVVLDSRWPARLPAAELGELLGAFAGLLVARATACARPAFEPRPADAPVGRSPAIRHMWAWVERAAPTRLPVLVRGETGSGKERICRALHALSRRAAGPWVALNCAALPEALLEAELFGMVRGAYTGADRDRGGLLRAAQGGTLLLDEVGELPPLAQAKLLRVLEDGRVRPVGADREIDVDVRILAATHRDLRARVASGSFRSDLLHRLAVVEIEVPALRERAEDLEELVRSLTPRLLEETGRAALRLERCALEALRRHAWPGNVRELHATLARALLRAEGVSLRAQDLRLAPAVVDVGAEGSERAMVAAALRASGGSVTAAAQRIGWSRQKLYRRIRALELAQVGSVEGAASGTSSSDSSTFQ